MKAYLYYCFAVIALIYYCSSQGQILINWGALFADDYDSGGGGGAVYYRGSGYGSGGYGGGGHK